MELADEIEERGGAVGIETDLCDCIYEFLAELVEFIDIELDERFELATFDPLMTVGMGIETGIFLV